MNPADPATRSAPLTEPQAPLVVLGMHRSGTSCLAGSLEECGLFLGDVNTRAPFNARGNREKRAIMDLHDAVLAANDGAWDRPPSRVIWTQAHRRERDRLIREYPADQPWGFKEPRSLLTLDGWLERFPAMRMVGTFRHPTAVAASLAHRNGFEPARCYRLWLAYNRRLLAYHDRYRFPLVDFDVESGAYRQQLRRVLDALRLREPANGLAFFESGLRHNPAEDAAVLPAETAALYAELRARAQ